MFFLLLLLVLLLFYFCIFLLCSVLTNNESNYFFLKVGQIYTDLQKIPNVPSIPKTDISNVPQIFGFIYMSNGNFYIIYDVKSGNIELFHDCFLINCTKLLVIFTKCSSNRMILKMFLGIQDTQDTRFLRLWIYI